MKNFLKLSLIALFSTLMINCGQVSLTGLVFDASTGEGVTDYSMTITVGAEVFDSADTQAQDITINDDGTYEIGATALESLRGADFVMEITAAGYVTSKVKSTGGLVNGDTQVSDVNVLNVSMYPAAAADVVINVVNTAGTAIKDAKVTLSVAGATAGFSAVDVKNPDQGTTTTGDVGDDKVMITDASGNATFAAATLLNNFNYTYNASIAGYVTHNRSTNAAGTTGGLTIPEYSDHVYRVILRAEDPYAALSLLAQSNVDSTYGVMIPGASATYTFSHNVSVQDDLLNATLLSAIIGAAPVTQTNTDGDVNGAVTYTAAFTGETVAAANTNSSLYTLASSGNTVTLTVSTIWNASSLDAGDYYTLNVAGLANSIVVEKAAVATGLSENNTTQIPGQPTDNNVKTLTAAGSLNTWVIQYPASYPACSATVTTDCAPTWQ